MPCQGYPNGECPFTAYERVLIAPAGKLYYPSHLPLDSTHKLDSSRFISEFQALQLKGARDFSVVHSHEAHSANHRLRPRGRRRGALATDRLH
jgi:hypothetical protein